MEMYPYYIGYIVILLASSMIGILLLIRIWGLRSIPGAYGLMLAVGSATEWSLTYAMEIYSANMAEKILWAKLEYFGISYVALGMFIFTMHYSGRGSSLTATRTTLLASIATIFCILALTNEWHHQIWTSIQLTNNLPFGPLESAAWSHILFPGSFSVCFDRSNHSGFFSNCHAYAKSLSKSIADHVDWDGISMGCEFYVYHGTESHSHPWT